VTAFLGAVVKNFMPDPITSSGLVAGVTAAFRLIKLGSDVIDLTVENVMKLSPEYGKIYQKVLRLAEERCIVDDANRFELKTTTTGQLIEPVRSPIIHALCNLYRHSRGVVYVMYAKPGQGKTFGAKAFLSHFYRLYDISTEENDVVSVGDPEAAENVHGFILSGQDLDYNYCLHLRDAVGGKEGVDGWIHALLLAMDRQPRNTCQPSILILDGMNSLGEEAVNERFIKQLYGLINGKKNVYVVILTSDPTVATKICSWNGGQRIRPMPNTYIGEATDPKWSGMNWSREQLIEAVKYEYYDQFPANYEFTFIKEGMTPLEATMAADDHLPTRKRKAPDSPKKLPAGKPRV
jgi:hypothetical protein